MLGKLRIEGKEYDLDDLELDDLEAIEEAIGQPLGEINFASAKALKWAAFVILRRERPDFSIEDAGRIKLVNMTQQEEEEPEEEGRPVPLHSASAGSA